MNLGNTAAVQECKQPEEKKPKDLKLSDHHLTEFNSIMNLANTAV